jgi:hypothetical protein
MFLKKPLTPGYEGLVLAGVIAPSGVKGKTGRPICVLKISEASRFAFRFLNIWEGGESHNNCHHYCDIISCGTWTQMFLKGGRQNSVKGL